MLADFLLSIVPFNQEELDEILALFKRERVDKGGVLLAEGQYCDKLYFVEKGIGRSYYLKSDGKEITQWFFGEGNYMSSVDSFFNESPSFYYLEVLEDSVLYSISKQEMDLLLTKHHKMERFVRLLSIELLSQVVHKMNAIQFQTARERYDYMLAEFPDISQRVPLGHIASYLGITQETLSRIRRKG